MRGRCVGASCCYRAGGQLLSRQDGRQPGRQVGRPRRWAHLRGPPPAGNARLLGSRKLVAKPGLRPQAVVGPGACLMQLHHRLLADGGGGGGAGEEGLEILPKGDEGLRHRQAAEAQVGQEVKGARSQAPGGLVLAGSCQLLGAGDRTCCREGGGGEGSGHGRMSMGCAWGPNGAGGLGISPGEPHPVAATVAHLAPPPLHCASG